MSEPSNQRASGRRIAAAVVRRPDVTVVLAVLLPLLTVATLLFVRPELTDLPTQPPDRTALSRLTLVCPSGAPEASLTTTADIGGTVMVREGKDSDESSTQLTPRAIATVLGVGPVVVTGEDDLAPGLVGGVFTNPLAAAACREPIADQWFTGVGAGAHHSSVLELVNPDAGPAVIDATLVGRTGVVDAPELRGVAVPARSLVRINLATTIPRRDELALQVMTSRGRVLATIRDRYDQLGAGAAARDWLPGQSAPAMSNLMLGLAPGSGQRSLVIANPGLDETRASVQVVTKDSVLAPEGVEDIVVEPETVTRISLSQLLPRDALADAVGLLVTSPLPVTTTVRSFVDGDLSHAVPGASVTSSAVLTPTGKKKIVLAGAEAAGSVTVTARDKAGKQVAKQQVDVVAQRGFTFSLPPETRVVEVEARGTSVVGSVIVTGKGAAVVQLVELVTDSLVAQVRPGLD